MSVFWYYILRWYERRQQPRAAGVGSRRREHEALDLACRMWVLTGARSVAGERPRQKKPKIDETERRTAKNEEHLIPLGVIQPAVGRGAGRTGHSVQILLCTVLPLPLQVHALEGTTYYDFGRRESI